MEHLDLDLPLFGNGALQGHAARNRVTVQIVGKRYLTGLQKSSPSSARDETTFNNMSRGLAQFLKENPRVRFHFTPTYSSWLNQVELWFAKIQGDVIGRGIFTSVADPAHKLRKYIRAYAKSAKPFRWTYTNPKHRIRTYEIMETAH